MRASHRAVLAIVISALSFTLPATAQERGNRAPAVGNPPSAQTMARSVAKRNDRNNLAIANRMTKIPEFVQALRNGDAKSAKRIFVAHGGSAHKVILVPVRGWNPTTGYNASEPFPDGPVGTPVCEFYHVIGWGWNHSNQSWSGYIYICFGPVRDGYFGWL